MPIQKQNYNLLFHIDDQQAKAIYTDLPSVLTIVNILRPTFSTSHIPINVHRKFTALGTHTNQMASSDGNPAIRRIDAL